MDLVGLREYSGEKTDNCLPLFGTMLYVLLLQLPIHNNGIPGDRHICTVQCYIFSCYSCPFPTMVFLGTDTYAVYNAICSLVTAAHSQQWYSWGPTHMQCRMIYVLLLQLPIHNNGIPGDRHICSVE